MEKSESYVDEEEKVICRREREMTSVFSRKRNMGSKG